jgi:imidazolonepropionase
VPESAEHLLVLGADELVTLRELGPGPCRGPLARLEPIRNGALWAADGVVQAVGTSADVLAKLPAGSSPLVLDAQGCCVVPGFVDPHTHLLYEGLRVDEHGFRLAGASYQEIAQSGGGIRRTVAETRAAGLEEQLRHLTARLDRLLANGTTTVEVKTGYGLTLESELLGLDVLAAAGRTHRIGLVPTFLGAHAVPPECAGDPDAYMELVIEEMLPLAREKARFCDVFCEDGYFTLAQSRRLLRAAGRHGFLLKLHADELSDQGGAALAAEVRAISADHLCCASEEGKRAMAQAGVIGVLLPAARFFLLAGRYADAHSLLELRVPIALGSDHSPTAPTVSMPFVIGLACAELRLTAAEALVAATRNAAFALGLGDRVGTLQEGHAADLVVLDVPSYEYLPCCMSQQLVRSVVKAGTPVC